MPRKEFEAFLEMGLARLAIFKKDWAEAEKRFNAVAENFPNTHYAPQAVYYNGISRYSASHDHNDLANTADTLNQNYSGSEWQLRSIPWLKEKSETTSG